MRRINSPSELLALIENAIVEGAEVDDIQSIINEHREHMPDNAVFEMVEDIDWAEYE